MHKMMVVTSSYALYTMMIMHEMVITSSYALMMMMMMHKMMVVTSSYTMNERMNE